MVYLKIKELLRGCEACTPHEKSYSISCLDQKYSRIELNDPPWRAILLSSMATEKLVKHGLPCGNPLLLLPSRIKRVFNVTAAVLSQKEAGEKTSQLFPSRTYK